MNSTDFQNASKKLLEKLSFATQREIVAKSRWTCESNWMMALVLIAGWDAANKANLQCAQAIGKAEMYRLMKALGIETPKNDEEFMSLILTAMETFITKDYFDYDFKILGPGKMMAVVRQCYAYTKVKSIGVEKDYECGCFGMRAGWYEAMGLEIKENLITCLKDGSDRCEIMVEDIIYPV
jgi:hypothetical protein